MAPATDVAGEIAAPDSVAVDLNVNVLPVEAAAGVADDGGGTSDEHKLAMKVSAAATAVVLAGVCACVLVDKRRRTVAMAWFGVQAMEARVQGVPVGIA